MSQEEDPPSQVTSRRWLRCRNPLPPASDPQTLGLWMMLCDDVPCDSPLAEIDVAWAKTKELVLSGTVPIIKAKCTTRSTRPERYKLSTGGAILYYTPDYKNKREVTMVAEAIHDRVDAKKDLFFRVCHANTCRQTALGERSICMYMYTVDKKLMAKREDDIFMLLD